MIADAESNDSLRRHDSLRRRWATFDELTKKCCREVRVIVLRRAQFYNGIFELIFVV